MPNVATVLKEEITRLARKEARTHAGPLKKANAQYRRDIASLKREVAALRTQVSRLERQDRKRSDRPAPAAEAAGLRFSPDWLKGHRERLDLAAADYAELIGVSTQTIYNWEHGRSRPQARQLAALAAIRGIGKREALRRLDG